MNEFRIAAPQPANSRRGKWIRRRSWLAAASALLLLAGCSTQAPNSAANSGVSSNAHQKSKPVVANQRFVDGLYVTSHMYQSRAQQVAYPEIHGLPNKQVQNGVNALLKSASIYVPTKGYQQPNAYTWTSRYTAVFQQGDIINFLLSSYFYPTGAAHGMPARLSLIVNLKNGQTYTLKDMFKPNTPYLKQISQVIAAEDTQHILDTFQKFTGVTHKDTIFLQQNGFVVDFTPYEWASYAQGFLDYPVPFASVDGIINKSGAFWTALTDKNGFPPAPSRKIEGAKILSLGYTPSTQFEQFTELYLGRGQYLTAWVGTRNGVSNTLGVDQQKIFFFLNGKYLGTDTSKAHGYVDMISPDGPNTISVSYDNSTANGTGAPFTIHYQWAGTKLALHGAFPPKYTWYP